MASRNPFSGIEQADVAFLQVGTVAFRCFVWQRNTQRTIGSEHQLLRRDRGGGDLH